MKKKFHSYFLHKGYNAALFGLPTKMTSYWMKYAEPLTAATVAMGNNFKENGESIDLGVCESIKAKGGLQSHSTK